MCKNTLADTQELTAAFHPFMLDCLTKYSLEEMEGWLSPFISEPRKRKIESVLRNRLTSFSAAAEAPTDIHNALAIVRTAEALGVSSFHVIDHELRRKKGKGTMQGANMWSHVQFYPHLRSYIQSMKSQGIVVAAAVPEGGVDVADVPIDGRVCFLFGNEMRGLSDEAVSLADYRFTLPMYGMTSSYNLSIAAALTLKEVTDRKRKLMGGELDISPKRLKYEMVISYIRTIGFAESEKILQELKCRLKK